MLFNPKNELDKKRARAYFERLINGSNVFEITSKKKQRTIKQNAYLHVCITIFAKEYGESIKDAKTMLKRDCPHHEFTRYKAIHPITKKEETRLTSTEEYDTEQAGKFIDWVREYAAIGGIYIPTSQEYLSNKWEIELEIEKQKKYL